MRTYELMVVLDPRMSEDDATQMTSDIRTLVENSGAKVIRMEVWGRRKLAYEIQKLKEGRYLLFYLSTDNGDHTLAEAERRLQQNDQVLRYLTVRTDEELRRAGLPLPSPEDAADERAVATEVAGTGDAGTGAAETGDAGTGATETADAKTADAETGDAETGDAETGDAETGDAETGKDEEE